MGNLNDYRNRYFGWKIILRLVILKLHKLNYRLIYEQIWFLCWSSFRSCPCPLMFYYQQANNLALFAPACMYLCESTSCTTSAGEKKFYYDDDGDVLVICCLSSNCILFWVWPAAVSSRVMSCHVMMQINSVVTQHVTFLFTSNVNQDQLMRKSRYMPPLCWVM